MFTRFICIVLDVLDVLVHDPVHTSIQRFLRGLLIWLGVRVQGDSLTSILHVDVILKCVDIFRCVLDF
jgi:hypothetical protein